MRNCWDKTNDGNVQAKAEQHGKAGKNEEHLGQYSLPCVSPLDSSCIHCIGVTQRDPLSSPCSPPPLALFLKEYKKNLVFSLFMIGKVAYTTISSSVGIMLKLLMRNAAHADSGVYMMWCVLSCHAAIDT